MLFASAESNGGKQPSLNSGRALTALSVEFKDTETLQEVNIIQIHKYTQLAWSAAMLTICEVVRKLDNLTFCKVFT